MVQLNHGHGLAATVAAPCSASQQSETKQHRKQHQTAFLSPLCALVPVSHLFLNLQGHSKSI